MSPTKNRICEKSVIDDMPGDGADAVAVAGAEQERTEAAHRQTGEC